MGKIIGVISLKGGVGKTSSVVSLGAALADFGKDVLLVDANFSAPNLGYHLNIIDPEKTLHEVLNRTANIKDAIYEIAENFHVLPSSMFGRLVNSPLKLRDKLSYWKKKYDFIVVDSAPSLNEETLGVINLSDEILVITTPDIPTLSATLKSVKFAKQRDVPIIGLVLNKVYNKNFELSLADIEDAAEVPVMAVIPHDVDILRSLSEFIPSILHKPKSEASQEYKKLAATLIGTKYKPVRVKRFWRWINPRKQDLNRQIFYTRVFRD